MTQEEKELLLKDLCARLPYGVKGLTLGTKTCTLVTLMSDGMFKADTYVGHITAGQFKPYLRPMSSMTEEEEIYYNTVFTTLKFYEKEDWLNAHHFDYRIVPSTRNTLIKSGLAIEAPKDMYKID